jgi:hypothetical protein
MKNQKQSPQLLNEGLRAGDLKEFVSDLFTVDQYRSKMGEDRDIVVLGFRVVEKNPAVDLMEFIEKGYTYILDADMSTGEEADGQYQVFVEIERTEQLPSQLRHLLDGISQLTDNRNWRFRYQKSPTSLPFSEETVMENIPLSQQDYDSKIMEIKTLDVKEFFDQGTVDVTLESAGMIKFSKPFSGDITAKFVAIGDYDTVKTVVPGALSLDESSQSQVLFLNKFLGNYDINKVGNNFLIRNGDQAVVIEKDRW